VHVLIPPSSIPAERASGRASLREKIGQVRRDRELNFVVDRLEAIAGYFFAWHACICMGACVFLSFFFSVDICLLLVVGRE